MSAQRVPDARQGGAPGATRPAGEQAASAGALPHPQLVAGFTNVAVDDPDPFAADAEPPKAMTVAVIVAGPLPLFWGAGIGSEVSCCPCWCFLPLIR